jgi:hypothetical protein
VAAKKERKILFDTRGNFSLVPELLFAPSLLLFMFLLSKIFASFDPR